MSFRRAAILLFSLGLSAVPATAGAEEPTEKGSETEGAISSNYRSGRFLLDGGLGAEFPGSIPRFPVPFIRGRYQVNRYFAVEQANRAVWPFLFTHFIGVRGQAPLPSSWSVFAAGRFGIGHAGGAGFRGEVAVLGVGIERLLSNHLLYGMEFGVRKYYGFLRPVVPHYQLNLGYAF